MPSGHSRTGPAVRSLSHPICHQGSGRGTSYHMARAAVSAIAGGSQVRLTPVGLCWVPAPGQPARRVGGIRGLCWSLLTTSCLTMEHDGQASWLSLHPCPPGGPGAIPKLTTPTRGHTWAFSHPQTRASISPLSPTPSTLAPTLPCPRPSSQFLASPLPGPDPRGHLDASRHLCSAQRQSHWF